MTDQPVSRSGWIGRLGKLLEDALLVGLLITLVVIAALQIVLRNVFSTGLTWSDELMRLLVLWLAMAAAVAASRDDRHIAIDVLSRFLAGRSLSATRAVIAAFTASVCALLTWHSGRFVFQAYEYEDVLLGGLPAWPFQVIIPLAFFLMTLRYLEHAWCRIREISDPGS